MSSALKMGSSRTRYRRFNTGFADLNEISKYFFFFNNHKMIKISFSSSKISLKLANLEFFKCHSLYKHFFTLKSETRDKTETERWRYGDIMEIWHWRSYSYMKESCSKKCNFINYETMIKHKYRLYFFQ